MSPIQVTVSPAPIEMRAGAKAFWVTKPLGTAAYGLPGIVQVAVPFALAVRFADVAFLAIRLRRAASPAAWTFLPSASIWACVGTNIPGERTVTEPAIPG